MLVRERKKQTLFYTRDPEFSKKRGRYTISAELPPHRSIADYLVSIIDHLGHLSEGLLAMEIQRDAPNDDPYHILQ